MIIVITPINWFIVLAITMFVIYHHYGHHRHRDYHDDQWLSNCNQIFIKRHLQEGMLPD